MFRRVSASARVVGSPMLAKSISKLPSPSPAGSPLLLSCASRCLSPSFASSAGGAGALGSSSGSPLLCSRAHQSTFSPSPPPTPAAAATATSEAAMPRKRRGKASKKTAAVDAAPVAPTAAATPRLVMPPLSIDEPAPAPAVAVAAEVLVDEMHSTAAAAAPASEAEGKPTRKRAKRAAKKVSAGDAVAEEDALDELSFFANMEETSGRHTPRTFEESTLVYNPLSGRMTNETSPSIELLKEVGFGVNASRQLCVEDPAAINQLAERIRAGTATLPARWPVTLVRVLGGILANPGISDPAEAVRQMMQVKINSVMRSRYASVVTASSSGDPSKAEVSDALNPLDEATDPTKAIELNAEQERVIDVALQGHHMYIGGSAGTGKTVLLRVLNRRLQAHRLRVAMTATTGVAGCHIGGCTFHHALGVSSKGEFLRRSSILDYDVIIIDEVSMFPLRLFEDFDRVLREEAGTPDLPFGGVQIILCGDFLQLGCINEDSVIHSKLFQDTFVKLRLETIVRQSQNRKFADDLQVMRRGIVPSDLTETVQQLPAGTMVESAVNLLPTNKEVHAANQKELERLEGDPVTLTPEHGITRLTCDTTATLLLRTKPDFNEHEFAQHIRSLLQATLDLPRASLLSLYRVYEDGHAMRVVLPPGESVAWREAMRERFLEVAGLINDLELGATVTEIVPNGDGLHTPENEEVLQKLMAKHPIAQPLTFKKGCRILLRANLSANLVNGSIGTVVDFVECKEANIPEFLRNESVGECIERYRVFCMTECGMPIPVVPVVKFHSGETVAIPPWEFSVGGSPTTNYFSLSTVALPLSLAYAFTVHKVQGLTLVGRVHLELSRMWPCEHLLYVAMSRVRNPEQLSMSAFKPAMVVADPDCVAFDVQLKAAADLTREELQQFPVSAWKRCNDTIYHLRRRGSSLRRLLEDAALTHGSNGSNGGNGSGGAPSNGTAHVLGFAVTSSAAAGSGHMLSPGQMAAMNARRGLSGGNNGGAQGSGHNNLLTHLSSVEQSVLIARRMRKLVKHVERVAKLSDARKKAKAAAQAVVGGSADTASSSASDSVESASEDSRITDELTL